MVIIVISMLVVLIQSVLGFGFRVWRRGSGFSVQEYRVQDTGSRDGGI